MSATIYTAYRNYSRFYLSWSVAQQDIANNRSLINWTAGIQGTPGITAYWYSNAVRLNSVYIDGQGNLASGTWSNITLANGASVPLRSGSVWVGHNSDGTKSFGASISGWLYMNGDLGASGNWSIATIPRNSQVTTNDSGAYDIGTPLSIYTNRKSGGFTHLIRIRHNDSNGTLIHEVNNVGASTVWTPTGAQITQMQNLIPTANSIVLNIGQYNHQVGQWSYINVRAYLRNANPIFENFTYRDSNPLITAITGDDQVLVKGKSILETTISEANKMEAVKGASESRYSIVYDGVTEQEPYLATGDVTTEFTSVSTIGQRTIVATAFDSRNNNTSVARQVTVYDYAPPTIEPTLRRENNFGDDTTVSLSGTWTPLVIGGSPKNLLTSGSLRYRYKEDGGAFSSWLTRNFSPLNNSWAMDTDFVVTLDNTKKYVFEFEISDRFETVTRTANVDVGKPIMFVGENSGVAAIGIGKMPENGSLDVVGDIYSNGQKISTGGWTEIVKENNLSVSTTAMTINFTHYRFLKVMLNSRQTGTQTTQNVLRYRFNGMSQATAYNRWTMRITEVPAIAYSTGDVDSIIGGISNGLHGLSYSEFTLNNMPDSISTSTGLWELVSEDSTWRFATGRYQVRGLTGNLTSITLFSTGSTYAADLTIFGRN